MTTRNISNYLWLKRNAAKLSREQQLACYRRGWAPADSGQRATDRQAVALLGTDIDNAHWKIRKCFRNTKKKTNTKRAKRTSDRSLQILYTVCTIHTYRQSYLLSMCVWVYIDFGLSVVMPGLRCRRRRRRRRRRRWQRPVMKARVVL